VSSSHPSPAQVRATHRTWRDELNEAFAAVDVAVEQRRRVIVAALEAGASLRAIADVTDDSFNTIYRWSGGRRGRRTGKEALDSPSGSAVLASIENEEK
jgi:transposase-like protein